MRVIVRRVVVMVRQAGMPVVRLRLMVLVSRIHFAMLMVFSLWNLLLAIGLSQTSSSAPITAIWTVQMVVSEHRSDGDKGDWEGNVMEMTEVAVPS